MKRPKLIVINGYPGSGKTSFAKRLADEIPSLAVLRKDAVKEWLYDEFGGFKLPDGILGRISAEILNTAAEQTAATGHNLLIESAFYADITRPILSGLVKKYNLEVLEIFMDVEPQVAHDRLRNRALENRRHAVHAKDVGVQPEFDPVWTKQYGVLGIGRLERYKATDFKEAEYKRLKNIVVKFLES